MKPVKFVTIVAFCLFSNQVFPQGASCTNPHVLALDSITRTFSSSPTSGNSAHCNAAEFGGSGKITVFSFTTDAAGKCVLVHFSTAPAVPAEIALYTGCSGGGSFQGLESESAVCFSDGTGYWAPAETLTLSPNTTYYLRVWTAGSPSITMSARNYSPPNNLCSGATWISADETTDNNACNKGSTEVFPIMLCAFSLENTAFYRYRVENTGVSSIQLNEINCDNSDVGNNNGFQIGFFVGVCGSLVKISCTTLAGGSLSAPTGSLAAGTDVYVAIDGALGSNCSYKITAFNAIILPVQLKYFTAWKRSDANRLTWLTTSETSFSHFVIEKSLDGANFFEIGSVRGRGGTDRQTSYSFDDARIEPLQYYRLKYVNSAEKSTYSNIIRVNRDDVSNSKVIFANRVTSQLALRLIDLPVTNLSVKIIDNSGREIKTQSIIISPGENSFNINTGSIAPGYYHLLLSGDNYRKTFSFVKS